MKAAIALIILNMFLFPGILRGQETASFRLLLNKKQININHVFINSNNIESINVDKKVQPAEVQITAKDRIKFVRLEKFLRNFSNHDEIYDKSIIPVFIIDNQYIDYPDSVKIDSSYYGEVRLHSLSNVSGVTGNCKNLTIVNIKLSSTPIIHIRGNDIQIPERFIKK
jgi:hypothetical protein